MPGQTDSTTILAAENQEVVALNEIVTAIGDITVPPAQIELTLNTTGLETAIATLQTALVSTLDALNVVVKNLNFCCTTTPPIPSEPGTTGGGSPGDPPAPGQEEPEGTTEEIASRRCKMAMWLVDYYLGGVVEWCDKSGIGSVINQAVNSGLGMAVTTIGAIAGACVAAVLSQFVTPGPGIEDAIITLIGGAIGGYIGRALVNGGELDFATLKEFIDTNRVIMICALYNSQNALSAHNALIAAIDDISPGLSPGNRNFISSFLGTASLALLFYVDEQFSVLEAWIAEQTSTCPCADVDPETGTPTNEYKCKAANYLFDNFTESFNRWGSIATMTWYSTPTFISALTGGLIITLMGPLYIVAIVGWNMLAKIVSFLGTIFWAGFDYFEAFEAIAVEFETAKEAIICELYLAADVDTVRTNLEGRINDYVGNVMTAHPEWADQADTYKDTLKALLPNTVLNILFETTPRDEITNYAPEDFTECACGEVEPIMRIPIYCEGSQYEQVEGTIVSGDLVNGPVTLSSVLVNYRCNTGSYDYDTAIASVSGAAYYFTWSYSSNVDWKVCCEWMDQNGVNHLVANAENVSQPLYARLVRIRCNNPAFPSFTCTYSWSS